MKVLMLSTDKNILSENTEVRQRMLDYGLLFEKLYILLYVKEMQDNSRIKLADNVFILPVSARYKFFYFWKAYRAALAIAQHDNLSADWVVTCQDPFETGLVGYLLKIKYKLPIQIQIHADIFSHYFGQESLKNKLRLMLAKIIIPKADGVRVVSKRIKNSLLQKNLVPDSKISVLPVFIDATKIKNDQKKSLLDLHKKYSSYDFIVLMTSRITREKNIELAARAVSEISKSYPGVLLLIVGEGPEKNKLFGYKNVIVEPWQYNDLALYYATADLFLLTSNYEGYGRSVIEAMISGLPIVMTDVGVAGDVVINNINGLVVPVRDVERLIEALVILIENKEKRLKLAEENKKIISIMFSRAQYLSLYKDSLSSLL